MKPLSAAQSTILRLTAECGRRGYAWMPQRDPEYIEGQFIAPRGPGASAAYRALVKAGLITPYPRLGPFAAKITEAGMKIAASEVGYPLAWINKQAQLIPDDETVE